MADALAFLDLVDELGIPIWLDGGWAVDALLGEQTRWHSRSRHRHRGPARADARAAPHAARLRAGSRDDTSAWNFVYGDSHGREIDFHVIELDADGNGQLGPHDSYPAAALAGVGTIGERTVRCISRR